MTFEQFSFFYEIWDILAPFINLLIEFFNSTLSELLNPASWSEDIPEWVVNMISPLSWWLDTLGIGDVTVVEAMFGAGIFIFLAWGFIKFLLPTS